MHGSDILRNAAGLAAMAVIATTPALALDTIEPFDRGATDFEMYFSQDGVGLSGLDRSVGSEVVIGYGLTDRISAHMGVGMAADGFLLNGETSLSAGLFGNVLRSDHWHVDLALGLTSFAGEDGALTAEPMGEINWDAAPDQETFGLFARTGLAVSGRAETDEPGRRTDVNLALGAYWTVRPGSQLLLEFAGSFTAVDPAGARAWESAGLALGWNRALSDSVEAIGQVCWCPPTEPFPASLGAMIGFVATLDGR